MSVGVDRKTKSLKRKQKHTIKPNTRDFYHSNHTIAQNIVPTTFLHHVLRTF